MKAVTEACPYCGEMHILNVKDSISDGELKIETLRMCSCTDARREISMIDVRERIEMLWGEGCEKLFERQAEMDEREKMVMVAGWIWEGFLESARLVTMEGDVCEIKDNDGRIVVARKQKRERKL